MDGWEWETGGRGRRMGERRGRDRRQDRGRGRGRERMDAWARKKREGKREGETKGGREDSTTKHMHFSLEPVITDIKISAPGSRPCGRLLATHAPPHIYIYTHTNVRKRGFISLRSTIIICTQMYMYYFGRPVIDTHFECKQSRRMMNIWLSQSGYWGERRVRGVQGERMADIGKTTIHDIIMEVMAP